MRQLPLFPALPLSRGPPKASFADLLLDQLRRQPAPLQIAFDPQGLVILYTTGDRRAAHQWLISVKDLHERAYYMVEVSFDAARMGQRGIEDTLTRKLRAEVARQQDADRLQSQVAWNRAPIAPTHLVLRNYEEHYTTVMLREPDGSLTGIVEVRYGPTQQRRIGYWIDDAIKQGIAIIDERNANDVQRQSWLREQACESPEARWLSRQPAFNIIARLHPSSAASGLLANDVAITKTARRSFGERMRA